LKPTFLLITSAFVALWGCGGTYTVTGPESELALEEVDQEVRNEKADLQLRGLEAQRVTILRLEADSLWICPKESESPVAIPLEQVSRIRRPAPVGNMIGGGFLGFSAGGMAGALLAYAVEPPKMFSSQEKEQSSLPAFLFLAGIVTGTVAGVVIGSEPTTYDFPVPPTPEHLPESVETAPFPSGTALYEIEVKRFLRETQSTVTILWQGRSLTLPRNAIRVHTRRNGTYRLVVPKALLGEE